MESSEQGKKFSAGFNAMEPLSDCVLCVTILDSNSRMYLCEPWDGLLMWANQVNDRHLPYIDTGLQAHFAGLNICISGRCEVCPLDSTYVYMEPGMLCIDEHTTNRRTFLLIRSQDGLFSFPFRPFHDTCGGTAARIEGKEAE